MRQQLVPVILLAAALSHTLSAPLDGAHTNDNTFRNNYNTRNIYDPVFCKDTVHGDDNLQPCSYYLQRGYQIGYSRSSYEGTRDRDEHYNGEGFRQEQWHNYPRRLDRLQHSPYDRNKVLYLKRVFEPDDPYRTYDTPDSISNYLTTNEYVLANDASQNVYDSFVASTSPLLILKIRLACLNSRRANRTLSDAARDIRARLYTYNMEEHFPNEELLREVPEVGVQPAKRGDSVNREDVAMWTADTTSSPERLPVRKRLFSLWSRLQSLSHKGHELHHRRHMHFLGLPDELGGEATLTAETRAALMRPPGSPLRWG